MGHIGTLAVVRCLELRTGDRENAEIALLTARIAELEQTAKDRPVSSSKEWATGDETAAKIADLADRLRTAEAQIMRYHDEQFADNNDPVPKAAYKDAADKARIAREAADQRIRELEAERDDWRVRTHAELEQRYRGRTANAERERDDAVKARDTAVVELRAAERRIAAMREPLTVESPTKHKSVSAPRSLSASRQSAQDMLPSRRADNESRRSHSPTSAEAKQHMTSEEKALLREIDRRIARSKRLSLIELGYEGEDLEAMLKMLKAKKVGG